MSDDDRDLDIDSDEEGFGGSGGGGGGQDKRAHHNALVIIIIIIIIIMVVVVDRTRELIIMPWLVILPRSSHRLTKLLTSTEFAGAEEARPHQGQLHRAEGRHPQPAGQAGGQVQQGSDPQKGGKYFSCVTYISDTCQ